MEDEKLRLPAWSRRAFLQTMGVSVPTLSLMGAVPMEGAAAAGALPEVDASRFTPVDLQSYYTTSPAEFGPREKARNMSADAAKDALIRMPAGAQNFRGVPFQLGPEGLTAKNWIVLSTQTNGAWAAKLEIPLQKSAAYICMAAFCDWDAGDPPPVGQDHAEPIGKHLADLELVYDDGSVKTFPLRRRFEVNPPTIGWGHLPFAALSHLLDAPRKLTDPLPSGADWGNLQTVVYSNDYVWNAPQGNVWISALENPEPERSLKALRLRAASNDPIVVCGITLFHGRQNPLRFQRLSLYRIKLPEATTKVTERYKVEVDLGIVARSYGLAEFDPNAWVTSSRVDADDQNKPALDGRFLYAEIAASRAAIATLVDTNTGTRYRFELEKVEPGKELEAQPGGALVEIIEAQKTWVHGRVVNSATHRPTPVRLAFRSKEGRYIPPYGHRTEVNASWFEDYGGDLMVGGTPYAYVDGTFQVELPVGDVYVEVSKGYEYQPFRKLLKIAPGQRELNLEISHSMDWRSKGWVTADTHVHFLSPSTAVLEGEAEGVNMVSLLAAQWGDLFTNVADLPYGPLISRDGETMVQICSENRQHIMGHVGLVGGHGAPVFPMSASGPSESYLGDPLWISMAEWSDIQRRREGLVVAVHFPHPQAELAADVALGKMDAVELYPNFEHFNALPYLEWYRYLNCGFRLPVVGGTDKMGASMPVGANRAYAYLGQEQFTFANWVKAIKSGNTFSTTGPLLTFQADGHLPGSEITLGAGGATVEVQAEARCIVPFSRLDVVFNGEVVASKEEKAGAREMTLQSKVHVPGPGWLAARCSAPRDTTIRGFSVAAHTSPVYVVVPGKELFSPGAGAYFLALVEGTQAWVDNLATRPDGDGHERIRKMLSDAHDVWHKKLHQAGIQH